MPQKVGGFLNQFIYPINTVGFEEALLQSVAERFAPGKFNDTPDPQRVVEVVSASPSERAYLTGA